MMRSSILILTALVMASTAGEGRAHGHPRDYAPMLEGWYRQYLHRPADAFGLRFWGEQLAHGESPLWVEAQILGSNEYFISRAASCPEAWAQSVYLDITGQAACSLITERLLCRLRDTGSRDLVAREILVEARTPPARVVPARPHFGASLIVGRPPLPRLAAPPARPVFHRPPPLPGPLPGMAPLGPRASLGLTIRLGR